MVQNNIHKKFQLNGVSFSNSEEILEFSNTLSLELFDFFKTWFSAEKTITVRTSGSTGAPKSIQLRKECMVNSAKATGRFFDTNENTSALLCLPIAFIAGKMMLVRAITLGWHLDIVISNAHPLKDVNKEYDFSAMVPLQLENSLPKINLIKKLIVGGGVVSNALKSKLQTISTQVFATYGMTETITHIAVKQLNTKQTSTLNKLNNFFYKTLPNVVIYKDKRNCLVINAPEVSDQIIFTNDVVRIISENQFEWLGRIDNVINSGGIKLYPEKIEEKLSNLISNRFFVTGVSDEKFGEKLVLIIEGNDCTNDIKAIIKSETGKSLSRFEVPKNIYYTKNFVETETGKIQRKITLSRALLNK